MTEQKRRQVEAITLSNCHELIKALADRLGTTVGRVAVAYNNRAFALYANGEDIEVDEQEIARAFPSLYEAMKRRERDARTASPQTEKKTEAIVLTKRRGIAIDGL